MLAQLRFIRLNPLIWEAISFTSHSALKFEISGIFWKFSINIKFLIFFLMELPGRGLPSTCKYDLKIFKNHWASISFVIFIFSNFRALYYSPPKMVGSKLSVESCFLSASILVRDRMIYFFPLLEYLGFCFNLHVLRF